MIDTDTVKKAVVSTARDVRDRAGDLAEHVRETASESTPAKRGKGWLLVVLAAIGIGAIVSIVWRAAAEEPQPDIGPVPDAFGEAVPRGARRWPRRDASGPHARRLIRGRTAGATAARAHRDREESEAAAGIEPA